MSNPIIKSWSEGYTASAPTLRFVEREGKKILQYAERRIYHDREDWVWTDVPMHTEPPHQKDNTNDQ